MRPVPLMAKISIASLLIYLLVGALLGIASPENELFHAWVMYGIYPVALISLIAGISWVRYVKSPLKFCLYSFLTPLVILGSAFFVTAIFPDAVILQKSMTGEVLDTERAPLAIMVAVVGMGSIVVSAALTIAGLIYLTWFQRSDSI